MNVGNPKLSAFARVKVEIEIQVSSVWGADCSIDQVHKQAWEEATGILRHALDKSEERRIKISGEPTVSAIVVEGRP